MSEKANILRIERISLNDGKGMRTVVFFKGCNMHCAWCSTPESQKQQQEVYFVAERCTGCGRCIDSCPAAALKPHESYGIVRSHSLCTNCFNCVDVCNYRAQQIYGREMTVEQVMHEIRKDEVFFFFSDGGVTLSGGDVFCQTEFAQELLEQCADSCINTCAELDMCTDAENVKKIIPLLDMVYIDIKLMNAALHKKWTGRDNSIILSNTLLADKICKKDAIHIRVPVIEGVNDDAENINRTVEFCKKLVNCAEIEFLPYHRLGTRTYQRLQRPYALEDRQPMNRFDVYQKIRHLCSDRHSFDISISGLKIYCRKNGAVAVTDEELKR